MLLLRREPEFRASAFAEGLRAVGLEIATSPSTGPYAADDVLVTWNRYGHKDTLARSIEARGGTVIVAENGYLGREWRGGRWYAMALAQHNGGGRWPKGRGPERWARIGEPLAPMRAAGSEYVVLKTRNIGPDGIREPLGWSERIAQWCGRHTRLPIRIRPHPGEKPCKPLQEDLLSAEAVITWGSGGALKALSWGIPVFHGFPSWIGAKAATRVEIFPTHNPERSREDMFSDLAWAMWNVEEIRTGEPFRCLLGL